MNILMVTNTFAPHVSGVARSVAVFTEEYRRQGHRVVVVAPKYGGIPESEADVIRVGALRNFAGTDYSVVIGPPRRLARAVDAFHPDIVHSHSPFLLGTTAARLARSRDVPLVFTHHTLYEQYTHYLPGDSGLMKRLAVRRATKYANLSQAVFAPSKSILDLLRERGVKVPIYEVPTGVPLGEFRKGDGAAFRARLGIPAGATVVGHVGRLAAEKNLVFLCRAMAGFLAATPGACAIVVGDGPSRLEMGAVFAGAGVADRVMFAGTLRPPALVDAYHAMDVFAFASLSETQGLVLVEAMAAGVAVVAIDAPGARETVRDRVNGRLLAEVDEAAFIDALAWVVGRTRREKDAMRSVARATAGAFALETVAARALAAYEETIAAARETDGTAKVVTRLAGIRGRVARGSGLLWRALPRQPSGS